MSDNEEPKDGEVPEVEPEEPRNFLKQEQLVESLSLVQRTAGNLPSTNFFGRWPFIRLQHFELGREGNSRVGRITEALHSPLQCQPQQE